MNFLDHDPARAANARKLDELLIMLGELETAVAGLRASGRFATEMVGVDAQLVEIRAQIAKHMETRTPSAARS